MTQKPRGKTFAAYISLIIIALLNIITFVLIKTGQHKIFQYYTVTSFGRMLFFSIMMLLPTLLSVVTLLILKKSGRKSKIAMLSCVGVSIMFSFVFAVANSIMPPCQSKTNDVENYLKFDEQCPLSQLYFDNFFLEEIPKNAENVKYSYSFGTYPDTNYDVFVEFSLPRDEYEKEKQRVINSHPNAIVGATENFDCLYISNEKKTTLDYIIFAYSDTTLTLRYAVSYIENVDINGMKPLYEHYIW